MPTEFNAVVTIDTEDFIAATIDYGDGRSYQSSSLDDALRNMFWHAYSQPGQYDVNVTVAHSNGEDTAACHLQLLGPPQPDSRAEEQVDAPKPLSSCNSNYEGACVPNATDVDCASGSGNGPAYVSGPVYVVGRDVYGLDGDNDGVGCE